MLSPPIFLLLCGAYLVVLFGIALWSRGQVETAEDFSVAGRRLSLPLSSATLFATWFGAGTLLSVPDQVREVGMVATALDPLGAGLCLLLAGVLIAKPLWQMQLITLSDFYRRRFGPRAETLSAAVMVPGYFGWIAAQFVALAGVLELFAGVPLSTGIAIVAIVGTTLTLLGGMWSVTTTEAFQTVLLIVGLVWLSAEVFARMGDGSAVAGFSVLLEKTPTERLKLIDTTSATALVGWLGVLATGSLGNLPGQDLTQRIFSARSARVAQLACGVAGVAYLVLGFLPPLMALAAGHLYPDTTTKSILPALASVFFSPAFSALFVVVVISAVLSTIQSAVLAPAMVLAKNLAPAFIQRRVPGLLLERVSVLVVAAASLAVSYLGSSAYDLLESAYEVGLAGMVVPLLFGVLTRLGRERAALASMLVGMLVWLPHMIWDWDHFAPQLLGPIDVILPPGLASAAVGMLAYLLGSIPGRPPRLTPRR